MHLDLTIRLGDLVISGTFVASIVAAYMKLIVRLTALEVKLEPLWTDYLTRRAK